MAGAPQRLAKVICGGAGHVPEIRMTRDTRGRFLPSPALTLARNLSAIATLVKNWRNVPGLELWQRMDGEFRILRHWPEP
jgi:hypothetical protein